MLICDMHCDLPYKMFRDNVGIDGENTHWSLKFLKNHNYVQFFAAFVNKLMYDSPFDVCNNIIDKFINNLSLYESITLVTDDETFDNALKTNKVAAMLTIEGGEALGGNIDNIKYFYDKGVRFITLTWNYPNQLGEGVGEFTQNRGLTEFGKKAVKEMSRLKMGIDVSHLTEKSFWDLCETVDTPFCATHSNSYTICPHLRNLTDNQFLEIVKRGGIVGINLYPLFLNDSEKADITDVVKHIEHFMALGGENTIALGSDFDGISVTPKGINNVGEWDNLFEYLLKINYPEKIIAKIAGENLKNYLIDNIF